jgi:hypothetical protein
MRRWIAVLVGEVAGLILAAPAQAGTYDVVSCGSPGAGGVPATYPIRVRIRRETGFPSVLGYSPAVKVRIR